MPYWIAYGYRSKERAADILEDMFANGEISPCEQPKIKSYKTRDNRTRWGISGIAA